MDRSQDTIVPWESLKRIGEQEKLHPGTVSDEEKERVRQALHDHVRGELARGILPDAIVADLVARGGWPRRAAGQLVESVSKAAEPPLPATPPSETPPSASPPRATVTPETPLPSRGPADPRSGYARLMVRGLVFAIIGLVVTIITYNLARERGGTYYVFYGAVIWGMVDFVRGLYGWLRAGRIAAPPGTERSKIPSWLWWASLAVIVVVGGLVIYNAVVRAREEAAARPTIRVEADGSTVEYRSLEDALNQVPDGGRIVLGSGTYRLKRPLDISRPVTLVGAGMDQTEITCKARGYMIGYEADGLFAAEGITFRHEGESWASVVLVLEGEVSFVGCRFAGAVFSDEEGAGSGLHLDGGVSGVVRESVAEKNEMGIFVVGQAQVTLEANTCKDNAVGIIFIENAGGTVRSNDCSGNSTAGIGVGEQANPTLEGNTCNGSPFGVGILVIGYSSATVRDNECSGNAVGIGVGEQAQPRLERNYCQGNTVAGISYDGSAGGTASENQCLDNAVGILLEQQASPTLRDNVCRNNSEQDVEDLRP